MIKYIDIPPVWATLFALGIWLLALAIPWPQIQVPNGIVYGLIGIALLWAGWAAVWFWRAKTPIEPRKEPKALIVAGPYRVNRNPIYSAMTLILLAVALYFGTTAGLLLVVGFPILITRRFILEEETALRRQFPDQVDGYFQNTRRW